jgi:hypothetical protein
MKPPHPMLGHPAKELYWLHLFHALAVAVAVQALHLRPHEIGQPP